MMHSRRWWHSLTLALVLLSGGLSAQAAFVGPETPVAERVKLMRAKAEEIAQAATPADARKAAQDFIDVALDPKCKRDVPFMNDYIAGGSKAPGLVQLVEEIVLAKRAAAAAAVPAPNQVAGIVAVTQVQLSLLPAPGTAGFALIAIDQQLARMLGHDNPAVRYWSAKCLAEMIPHMRNPAAGLALPLGKVVVALTNAAKVETSPLAKVQMLRALALAGDPKPLIASLQAIGTQMRGKAPTAAEVDVADLSLTALAETIGASTLAKPEETAALSATINIMSFAANHLFNGKIDAKQGPSVINLVRTGVAALNAIAKNPKWITPPERKSDPTNLAMKVIDIITAIQEKHADVPKPPAVSLK